MATRVLTGTNRSIERLIAATPACSDKPYSMREDTRYRTTEDRRRTIVPPSVPYPEQPPSGGVSKDCPLSPDPCTAWWL